MIGHILRNCLVDMAMDTLQTFWDELGHRLPVSGETCQGEVGMPPAVASQEKHERPDRGRVSVPPAADFPVFYRRLGHSEEVGDLLLAHAKGFANGPEIHVRSLAEIASEITHSDARRARLSGHLVKVWWVGRVSRSWSFWVGERAEPGLLGRLTSSEGHDSGRSWFWRLGGFLSGGTF